MTAEPTPRRTGSRQDSAVWVRLGWDMGRVATWHIAAHNVPTICEYSLFDRTGSPRPNRGTAHESTRVIRSRVMRPVLAKVLLCSELQRASGPFYSVRLPVAHSQVILHSQKRVHAHAHG